MPIASSLASSVKIEHDPDDNDDYEDADESSFGACGNADPKQGVGWQHCG
jgi:hypothetical protein